jgi:hypothetical protein
MSINREQEERIEKLEAFIAKHQLKKGKKNKQDDDGRC